MNTITSSQNLTGAQFSTYRVGGPLEIVYQPETANEAIELLTESVQNQQTVTLLGAGSNTLIASQGISGVTFITKKLTEIQELGENQFYLGAGVHLAKVARLAQQNALGGAEFMIGIPGTLGGAIRMNAGAMGQETSGILIQADIFNLQTGKLERWPADKMGFRYRHSNLDPTIHVVLGGTVQLKPGNEEEITQAMESNLQFRKAHHPIEPNGGSVFRNPAPDQTVGKLLDELGAKQWQEGEVRISPRHANFIINLGTGTSTDVLRLMTRMKQSIQEHYGLSVIPENVFIGNATSEEQTLWKELTGDSTQ